MSILSETEQNDIRSSVYMMDGWISAIYGRRDDIHFRAIKSGNGAKKIGPSNLRGVGDQLFTLNADGWDIYSVINSGGDTDGGISKINALYVDFDAGRGIDNQYHSDVKAFKRETMTTINCMSVTPSIVTETRNGYHVYWLVDDCQVSDFRTYQSRLIATFGSDPSITNESRLMRVPGFFWVKVPSMREQSAIVTMSGQRYSVSDVMSMCVEIAPIEAKQSKAKAVTEKSNDRMDVIRRLDAEAMRAILGLRDGEVKYFPNRTNMLHHFKTQSIAQFLGIGHKSKCLFHDSNSDNMSVSIFETDDRRQMYKCHSRSCHVGNEKAMTLMTLIVELSGQSEKKVINFLKAVYRVDIRETDYQREQKDMLRNNIEKLMSPEFRDEYPALYREVSRYMPELIMLHEVCIQHTYDQPMDDQQKALFFASLGYLQSRLETKSSKVADRINKFCFLTLVEKLSDSGIPLSLLTEAKHQAAIKKQKREVNFYAISEYDRDALKHADEWAIKFREKCGTMTGWSREFLFRAFGEDVADRVYPGLSDVTEDGDKIVSYIGETSDRKNSEYTEAIMALIDGQGYATEADAIAAIGGSSKQNEVYCKRMLGEMLDLYGLNRIRQNKAIKAQYGVTGDGYGYIIVPKEIN